VNRRGQQGYGVAQVGGLLCGAPLAVAGALIANPIYDRFWGKTALYDVQLNRGFEGLLWGLCLGLTVGSWVGLRARRFPGAGPTALFAAGALLLFRTGLIVTTNFSNDPARVVGLGLLVLILVTPMLARALFNRGRGGTRLRTKQ
jgi:peptidoglycan/LPS O-acetylase OafA/YrhL